MDKLKFLIKEILDEVLNEDYPADFNFETFESIKSYSGKLDYAKQRLKRIGSGSARVVFQVDNDKVLKIAKNKKGLAQNSVESEYYLQNYDIIARVFDTDNDDFWLEMEYARKLTPTRFKEITEIDIKKLWHFLWYKKEGKKTSGISDEEIELYEENEFIINLMELVFDYQMPIPADLSRISSYGEVKRDGKSAVVLVDFGLTQSVWYQYYRIK
jgi:hypothetical protein